MLTGFGVAQLAATAVRNSVCFTWFVYSLYGVIRLYGLGLQVLIEV